MALFESHSLTAGLLGFAGGAMTVAAAWAAGRMLARRRTLAPLRPRRAADEARASGERRVDMAERLETFEHVTDSAAIGMFSWDMVTDAITWSAHHYAIFGYPQGSEVRHAMFSSRIHPDDLAGLQAVVDGAIAGLCDYVHEFRICLPDGTVRHLRGSGRVASNGHGRPLRMYGAVIDVTETAEALKGRTEREWELATVAANLPDIISRFDRARRRIFVSPRIEQVTGKPPSWFLGKTHDELGLDTLLAARWRAVLEDVIANGRVREFEYQYMDHDGRERFFITRAIPAFDADGAVESVLTIATDHTERERVTRQLRADGVVLEKADLRKNEYLATLAHELRGPLAPISSAVQLMKISPRQDIWARGRDVIERQVGQLAALVDDLMEIGRISSGKMVIDPELLELGSVIDQAVENVRPLIDTKDQQLVLRADAGEVWLQGDGVRLTQVFSNLLTNASKYSPFASTIVLGTRRDGGHVLIEVEDEGVGLTESAMLDIFDMFVQVHPTGTQAQGGLGIGLSLVRQLVRLHGGEVGVRSAGLGKGACFSVRLPVAAEAGAAEFDGPAGAAATEPAAAPAVAPALRVLVVDDNVDGAQTLASLLDALGHSSSVAHTGQDAVRLAGTGAFDLVFLDLGLPDISGIQVALTLRGKPETRQLRLVALSGLGREQDRFMTRSARFNEHLVKPILMPDVLRLVGRANVAGEAVADAIADAAPLADPVK